MTKARNTGGRSGQPSDSRTLPNNLQAEESLLGAALSSRKALEILALQVRPEDFYRPANSHVAAALIDAFEREQAADPVTIFEALKRSGVDEQVGGLPYLLDLQGNVPAISNAGRYAEIVHDHATARRLIAAASQIADNAYDLPPDVHDLVLRAQSLVSDVASNNGARSYSTLEFADVPALVSGELPTVEPDFLQRSDGMALFYAGEINGVHGEPGGGKSFIACEAVRQVLTMGGSGIYLDYEDSARGIIGRLLALGCTPAEISERFSYVRPQGPFGAAERVELEARLAALNPDIVVIDGVTESVARQGLSENDAVEYSTWAQLLPRWLASTGAAVVLIDHVAKDQEGRGRWQRGSGAKLAVITGAEYEIRVASPFSRKRAGRLRLILSKDRHGTVGEQNSAVADVTISPAADGEVMRISVDVPKTGQSPADPWKPTRLMEKVSEELERAANPLTATAVKSIVHSEKPKLVTEAIGRLIAEGYVTEVKVGRSKILRLDRPYHADGDPGATEPPEDGQRDLSDEGLFADNPGIPPPPPEEEIT